MFNFLLFTYFPPIKLKQNNVTAYKRGRMPVTKISIGCILPCQRIGVQEWKVKFLTQNSFLIFRAYETKFFTMVSSVSKWGAVPCFRLLNFRWRFKGIKLIDWDRTRLFSKDRFQTFTNQNQKTRVVGRIRTCAGRPQWISSPSP